MASHAAAVDEIALSRRTLAELDRAWAANPRRSDAVVSLTSIPSRLPLIERTLKRVTVTIQTSRPGIIIGKGGQEVDRIREELKKLTNPQIDEWVLSQVAYISKPQAAQTVVNTEIQVIRSDDPAAALQAG